MCSYCSIYFLFNLLLFLLNIKVTIVCLELNFTWFLSYCANKHDDDDDDEPIVIGRTIFTIADDFYLGEVTIFSNFYSTSERSNNYD